MNRFALLAEGAISAAHAQGTDPALGGRLTLRLRSLALVGSLDLAGLPDGAQPRMEALLLGGAGLTHDLSPRLAAHGALLVGVELVDIDDYVDGIGREFLLPAGGARVGLEWRGRSAGSRRVGFAPVLGLSATLLYVEAGSDRLRAIEWGGFTALLSVTLGVELARPPREPPEAEPGVPSAGPQGDPPPPDLPPPAPRLPRLAAEVGVSTSLGDGPSLGGAGRISWEPSRAWVVAAGWDGGEGDAREVHHLVTAGAGARALRRGVVLEALALGGVHRIEEADAAGWHAQDLPAFGARAGVYRAPRGAGASLIYGASATVLVSPHEDSLAGGDDVGGIVGIFAATLGLAL